MSIQRSTGEPYDLEGKRLVFTSWHYVRQSYCWWYDKEGNHLDKSVTKNPWEAVFQAKECPWGIRLVAQGAERVGPLLQPERPWEEKGIQFNTILRDGGIFRTWGVSQSKDDKWWPCYFESKDGLHWGRPNLGMAEYDGSRDNNIYANPRHAGMLGGAIFKDPSAPKTEIYKSVGAVKFTPEETEAFLRKHYTDDWQLKGDELRSHAGVSGAVSPDGLNWTILPEPLTVECTDTQVIAYYDKRLRKYVLYTRTRIAGPRSQKTLDEGDMGENSIGEGTGRRSIGRSESDDFRHFPISETIFAPGMSLPPSDTLYTNCRTEVPGAPDHHLMFPTIWHQSDDTTSVALASSQDGKLWDFVPGPPVLTTTAFGEWDGGCIFAHPNLIELPNGDFALPYTGFNFPHKYPRGEWRFLPGLAVWPKGRLVALEAPERGEFTTPGLMPPGRKLRINALTQRAGSILVEVAGFNGKPIKGRSFDDAVPIIGDRHWTPVTWKGQDDLGFEEGRSIILRFRMDKAKIFGLEFE